MKRYIIGATLLFVSFLLLGCIQVGDTSKDAQIDLYKTQVDYNVLKEKCDVSNSQLAVCLTAKSVCEGKKCPDCNVCADCSSGINVLTTQLNTCNSQKSNLNDQLDECDLTKAACDENLSTCESALPKVYYDHFVAGNLGVLGDYRTTTSVYDDHPNVKSIVVGLDYNGGTDSSFAPFVSTEYGLNLIRWYTLTKTATGFSIPGDDTVLAENYILKIKATEFTAATSKEHLAIRRIIVISAE